MTDRYHPCSNSCVRSSATAIDAIDATERPPVSQLRMARPLRIRRGQSATRRRRRRRLLQSDTQVKHSDARPWSKDDDEDGRRTHSVALARCPPDPDIGTMTEPTTEHISGTASAEQSAADSDSPIDYSSATNNDSCHKRRAHETMTEGRHEDITPAAPLQKRHKRQPVAPETIHSDPSSSSIAASAIVASVPSVAPSASLSDDSAAAASQIGSSAQMHPRNIYRSRPPVS